MQDSNGRTNHHVVITPKYCVVSCDTHALKKYILHAAKTFFRLGICTQFFFFFFFLNILYYFFSFVQDLMSMSLLPVTLQI